MQRFLLHALPLLFAVLVACKPAPPNRATDAAIDVVIVPGCPSNSDGTVSLCQWERAAWAAALYEDGVTERFITSCGAVYNRYIEAEALAAAMVALGVPEAHIHLETQALHSDENLGYGFAIADALGYRTVGYATHGLQANVLESMVRGWGDRSVADLRLDWDRVDQTFARGLPMVRTEPVPAEEWLPLDARERVLADRLGEAKRLPSWALYTLGAAFGRLKGGDAPEPPVMEPTLRGLRHRVDTAAWDDGLVAAE
jgi:hypothetical protein